MWQTRGKRCHNKFIKLAIYKTARHLFSIGNAIGNEKSLFPGETVSEAFRLSFFAAQLYFKFLETDGNPLLLPRSNLNYRSVW